MLIAAWKIEDHILDLSVKLIEVSDIADALPLEIGMLE